MEAILRASAQRLRPGFKNLPNDLRLNEIALLVALPQSPERRRPDRYPGNAYAAKIDVLKKVQGQAKCR